MRTSPKSRCVLTGWPAMSVIEGLPALEPMKNMAWPSGMDVGMTGPLSVDSMGVISTDRSLAMTASDPRKSFWSRW